MSELQSRGKETDSEVKLSGCSRSRREEKEDTERCDVNQLLAGRYLVN